VDLNQHSLIGRPQAHSRSVCSCKLQCNTISNIKECFQADKICTIPIYQNFKTSKAGWVTPLIPALKKLREKDLEFEANLGYIGRLCLKKTKQSKLKK
jgi:hypothetical protein